MENKINEQLLKELFREIRILEIRNIKTKTYNDEAMVNTIKEKIHKCVQEDMKNED